MIALYTDFSLNDPYVGQLHAVLASQAPGEAVIDLFHGVPSYDIRAGAFLLPAYAPPQSLPERGVFLCVVDPGVGGPRRPILLEIEGRHYVGPDNGLFRVLAHRAGIRECREIEWRPERLSRSFHGRDLFAPVAAMLCRGEMPQSQDTRLEAGCDAEWPEEMFRILYMDHFGNAVTGVRAEILGPDMVLRVRGERFRRAECFSDLPAGRPCWYPNANGLAEIAVSRGSAADCFGIRLNDVVEALGGAHPGGARA